MPGMNLALVLFLATVLTGNEERDGFRASGPEPLDVNGISHSIYPVGSRITDFRSRDEFRPSTNFPRALDDNDSLGEPDKVSIVVEPPDPDAKEEDRGLHVSIVNRLSRRAAFSAIDSCLYLVQEAKTEKGDWLPIQLETPATGPRDCAVGRHRVFLGPGEYWKIAAPQFTGPLKTKIRFRLDMGLDDAGAFRRGRKTICSREFDGAINPEQFGTPVPP